MSVYTTCVYIGAYGIANVLCCDVGEEVRCGDVYLCSRATTNRLLGDLEYTRDVWCRALDDICISS